MVLSTVHAILLQVERHFPKVDGAIRVVADSNVRRHCTPR